MSLLASSLEGVTTAASTWWSISGKRTHAITGEANATF
jgi:hypothetical protein